MPAFWREVRAVSAQWRGALGPEELRLRTQHLMRAWLLALLTVVPRACDAGSHSAATEELHGGLHPRRGLLLDVIAVGTGLPATGTDWTTHADSGLVFLDQPLVSCAEKQPLAPQAGTAPTCCTLTVADCAERCLYLFKTHLLNDISSVCTAFQFARQDNTQLPSPLPSAPVGQAWSRCVLLTNITASSCTSEMLFHQGANGQDLRWVPADLSPGAIVWDTYFIALLGVQDGTAWRLANVTVSGMAPAALESDLQAGRRRFVSAVREAIQARCCGAIVGILSVANVAGTADAVVVQVQVQSVLLTDSIPFVTDHVVDVISDAAGHADLLTSLQRRFPNVTGVSVQSLGAGTGSIAPSATLSSAAGCSAAGKGPPPISAAVIAVSTALGVVTIVLVLTCLSGRASAKRHLRRLDTSIAALRGDTHDVFISYRRTDADLADAVRDNLLLSGLRVWYDRGGAMAGRPFEDELFKAVRDAPALSIILTVGCIQSWAFGHDPRRVDFVLAELIMALHFQLTLGHRGRHIFPLLVGPWSARAGEPGVGEREWMLSSPQYQQAIAELARADLPPVVPAATLDFTAALVLRGSGGKLHPALRDVTMRQLMVGSAAGKGGMQVPELSPDEDSDATATGTDDSGGLAGLLNISPVVLSGPDEQASLVLRHRYAATISKALRAAGHE